MKNEPVPATTPDTQSFQSIARPPRDPFEIDLRTLKLPPAVIGDRDIVRLGEQLEGKHIALVITGSIASYKGPDVVRMLRRYGATVTVYLTEDGAKLVSPEALGWAVGQNGRVVTGELTGGVEHLGREDGTRYDGYLVCPATYNTINKVAQGIADTPALALLAAARGRCERDKTPLVMVPTMNGDMVNDRLIRSLGELQASGAFIMKPRTENQKFELPDTHSIAICMSRQLSQSSLVGMPILLTAGPTPVQIDKVRIIANIFRGTLGVHVARELITRGADVRLLLGGTAKHLPEFVRAFTKTHATYDEYRANVLGAIKAGYDFPGSAKARDFAAGIFSAAVADYRPLQVHDGKISSGGKELTLPPFGPTPKVIKEVREACPNLPMLTFKLLVGVTEEALFAEAKRRLADYQLVVANRLEDMKAGSESHNAWLVSRNGIQPFTGNKAALAGAIVDWLEAFMDAQRTLEGKPTP